MGMFPCLERVGNGFLAVTRVQLAYDTTDVFFHGFQGDEESAGSYKKQHGKRLVKPAY